jgi:hypothetical protein
MTMSQIAKKNIALSEKFSNYIMKNPKAADKISSKATIIVIPKNDKILEAQNRKILESYSGRSEVYVAKEMAKGWVIEACAVK